MEEILYFELDNWFCGRDYPNAEPFIQWMNKDFHSTLGNDEWCKENKICVEAGPIDMSLCVCVSAPKSWVEANCPKLLTDEECGGYTIVHSYDEEKGDWVDEKKYEPCKYSSFICKPYKSGGIFGYVSDWPFREYKEENFGVHWNDWYWEKAAEDADEEDEEDLEDDE